jgi:hypothetical protein
LQKTGVLEKFQKQEIQNFETVSKKRKGKLFIKENLEYSDEAFNAKSSWTCSYA